MDLRNLKLPELTDSHIVNNFIYLLIACISIVVFRQAATDINLVFYHLSVLCTAMPSIAPYAGIIFYTITSVVTVVSDILILLMLVVIVITIIRIGTEFARIIFDKNTEP